MIIRVEVRDFWVKNEIVEQLAAKIQNLAFHRELAHTLFGNPTWSTVEVFNLANWLAMILRDH